MAALLWLSLMFSCFSPLVSDAQASAAYEVTITGLEDPELVNRLKEISDTFALRERPLATLSLLQRRVTEDKDLFLKQLRARGYYAAEVAAEIEREAVPVRVTFRIDKGPVFVLKSVNVVASGQEPMQLPEPGEIGLAVDRPFETAQLLDGEKILLRRLRSRGFPFPEIAEVDDARSFFY